MASKVFPAMLLTGFLILLIVSFKPTLIPSARTTNTADTTKVVMKQYWMVLLRKGPQRNQDSAAAALIQQRHIANIERLARSGQLVVAGPFGDDGDLRGIFILDCPDSATAASLVKTDTAIITGRLSFEIKPWWTARNCVFK
ncbi:YciI family protein [Chitinophaga japonensis]|uniref:Uncharacterized protein YciI n=1 Tax=Chitinophaga japonensis TaxID=104662 RepID=A0A562SMS9_CHIJA|nr:YciI family protein [Chitinophaga japonensis]TWI82000.1 uncharacterized protein YciI [Chitinophaga japonensis]